MTAAAEIIGVGSPIVDLLAQVDDDFLTREVHGAKGGMELVDLAEIDRLIAAGNLQPVRAAGGAASNTTVGCAQLGIGAAFIGSCGDDEPAAFYKSALQAQACEPRLVAHAFLPTGRVLCLITPDAQRTMRTCLGAAAALDPAAVRSEWFDGARMVMVEGYLAFNPDLLRAVVRAAREAGCRVALDLASFEVVNAARPLLAEMLAGSIDVVFANEDEARAWHEGGVETALDDLSRRVAVAVVKQGAQGSWVVGRGERHHVDAEPVTAVIDTTGAGDCFASGFLAGYLRGLPLDLCGKLGSLAGAAAVQVTGAQPSREAWLRIRGFLEAFA